MTSPIHPRSGAPPPHRNRYETRPLTPEPRDHVPEAAPVLPARAHGGQPGHLDDAQKPKPSFRSLCATRPLGRRARHTSHSQAAQRTLRGQNVWTLAEGTTNPHPWLCDPAAAPTLRPRAARGPAGGRTPRASACGRISRGPRGAVRRRLEQVWRV